MRRSNFTSNFILLNHCQSSFGQWQFARGMCFGDETMWWAKEEKRRGTVHEGLDLCCYVSQPGEVVWFNELTRVPVLYAGRVAEIFPDFMGQSVLVRHPETRRGRQFCSIYAHIQADKGIHVGVDLPAGQCLGQCAPPKRAAAHLHLSIIELSPAEKAESWPLLIRRHARYFLDPQVYI